MAINLKKDDFVELEKELQQQFAIGLGWKENDQGDADFDLDVSAFLLNSEGKTRRAKDLIFYKNQNRDPNQPERYDILKVGVVHMGDNKTGRDGEVDSIVELEGQEDKEQIFIDTDNIPSEIQKIVFTVTIYDYAARNQNFGQISDAYIRIIDRSERKVLAIFNLTEDYSKKTSIIAGALVRDQESKKWLFHALGEGREGGLADLCKEYGVKYKIKMLPTA